MSIETLIPKNLETRFTEPEGWLWHAFTRAGRNIRYGTVSPKDSVPDAVVVGLQGVREFSEKYFEIARWCLDRNLAFWCMDWMGQGKSNRYLDSNPQKRHGHNFNQDVADMGYFIEEYVKPASVHPDMGRIPMALLGHSMGANIGMRYLGTHTDMFECAAFTAPMIGIKAFRYIPQHTVFALTSLVALFGGRSYIPGGADWQNRSEHARLTSDPVRGALQNQWYEADPAVRCGDVTLGWLNHAQRSCLKLQNTKFLNSITTPCLFAIPEYEDLVDNKRARQSITQMRDAVSVDYPKASHEILMEKDNIRDDFLNRFYTLIKQNILDQSEALKPF